jgi:hypothetical protein
VESPAQSLVGCFERVYLIHLRERVDRYVALERELASVGIPLDHPKVRIMEGQWSESPNGFPSLGAYGNFMSHLRILREAKADGLESVWVMEDDVIFRSHLRRADAQASVVQELRGKPWDIAYLGHHIETRRLRELRKRDPDVEFSPVAPTEEFLWAHCYAVRKSAFDPLLAYLEETLTNPPGHPRGGRMYIDGALNMYRRLHPHAKVLVSTTNLVYQRSSPSSLAGQKKWQSAPAIASAMPLVRSLKDSLWRHRLIP